MTIETAGPRTMRLMGGVLVALWAALAVAIAAAYRPGGPLDVAVMIASFLPVLVAAVPLIWLPRPRTGRDRAILTWTWIAAVLLATSLLYGVASSLAADGPQTLVPSAEVAYAAFLALLFTCGFSLMGLADGPSPGRSRERAATAPPTDEAASIGRAAWVRGVSLGLLAATGISVVFGAVLLVNDRNRPVDPTTTSRHGPTDPALVPPECDAPAALGPNAAVEVRAWASVDDVGTGEALLAGRRSGGDEAWSAGWERGPHILGSDVDSSEPDVGGIAYRRVGPQAWVNLGGPDPDAAGTTWREVAANPFALVGSQGLTMDGPTQTLVGSQPGAIVPEDVGLEVIDGARARHCRTFIDGPTALATFLPLRWLMVGEPIGLRSDLAAWRGELDWWVFADGQLGRAVARVSGLASDAWVDPPGIRGEIGATLEALDRDLAADIGGPPA
jgi:hypothetical protein